MKAIIRMQDLSVQSNRTGVPTAIKYKKDQFNLSYRDLSISVF
ncbi:hypothetical protein [Longirhabdus pacifica]|nr:hypothetical protein [Longirhabdus pacifica]